MPILASIGFPCPSVPVQIRSGLTNCTSFPKSVSATSFPGPSDRQLIGFSWVSFSFILSSVPWLTVVGGLRLSFRKKSFCGWKYFLDKFFCYLFKLLLCILIEVNNLLQFSNHDIRKWPVPKSLLSA